MFTYSARRLSAVGCVAIALAGTAAGGDGDKPVASIRPGPHAPGVLIDKGVAHASIVTPATRDAAAKYAAEDLQQVLWEISNVALPLVKEDDSIRGNRILIGDTGLTDTVVARAEREALGEEGYIARLRGRDLALVGGGPYGTIYAVAELYDRLGARWYMAGELGACVPCMATVRFDEFDVRREPSFRTRWVGGGAEWILRNRVNRRTGIPGFPPAFVVAPGIYHTQEALLPDQKYGKEHPEYFARVDGERSRDVQVRKLCNANPAVALELSRNMAKLLRQDRHIDLISLSPTDGQQWCECPDCRELDDIVEPGDPPMTEDQRYSRRQLVLYNRVAQELEKEFSNQLILAGAYSKYTLPPRDPSLRAHKNLAVVIARYLPSVCCYTHAINDSSCPANQRFLELIRAWRKHTPHIWFYEYYYKGSWCDLPWPLVRSVASDIPQFRSMGVQGISSQWSSRNVWSHFLVQYVAARLLWDHTTDVDALLDEFYYKFYGRAAAPMKHYHELIEKQRARCPQHIAGQVHYALSIFTPDVTAQLKRDIKEAQRLAVDDLVKKRLDRMAILTDYTDRLTHALRVKVKAKQTKNMKLLGEAYELADAVRDDVLDPNRNADYEGVIKGDRLRSPGGSLARWMNNWRREVIQAGLPDPEKERARP